MMIGPETYYEENLKGKTAEQIMTAIRSLKREINRLKNVMEYPEYQCMMHPSEGVRISCLRDYLERAKQALVEAGGEYTPTAAERRIMAFDENIENISKITFNYGDCFVNRRTYINFKSTSKSFRNKTRVENPKENWAIFKDVHEPIIDRDTWEQVQKLVEKTKRRPPKDKNQKKSIFTSFLYCGDCGHKLWFNFNQKNPSIRFFSCSNYKGMRGTCENTHYIREDALEQIVLMELRMLADFLESAEEAFAELLEKKTNKDMHLERTAAEGALATARARSQKLLGLFEKLYEDNVEGKVTDEWFMRLSQKYDNEQEELKRQTLELKEKLDSIDRMQTAKDDFLKAIRKFMEMRTLTPVILRELIEKIEVFPVEGTGKDRTQRVIVHYRFIGTLDVPGVVPRPPYILDSRKGVAIEYLSNAV